MELWIPGLPAARSLACNWNYYTIAHANLDNAMECKYIAQNQHWRNIISTWQWIHPPQPDHANYKFRHAMNTQHSVATPQTVRSSAHTNLLCIHTENSILKNSYNLLWIHYNLFEFIWIILNSEDLVGIRKNDLKFLRFS